MIQIGAKSATLDTPVEHLMACHRRIEQRLDTLNAAAGHLENDRARALDAIGASLRFLDSNGAMHTEDEESSLFPRLRPKLSEEECRYLESLEQQHDRADAIYAELKETAGQLSAGEGTAEATKELIERYRDCAAQLRDLYREHIASEDEVLTSLAKRSLSDADLAAITAEMRSRRGM